MKKQLLALAIGSMVVAPSVAMADKGPIVYGKANVSYENQDNDVEDTWKLQSNASRLGVKGDLDLDFNQIKAIYKAEFEISIDDGDKDGETFSQRNIYGGFAHDAMGTLIAGKFDTPLKVSQGKVDQFNDLQGDIKNIMAGENRTSNMVQYSTPSFADALSVNVALIPGEDQEEGTDENGVADAVSSSIVFDKGMFYGALAYDSEIEDELVADSTMDGRLNILRATGLVRLDMFEFGALYQLAEEEDGEGEEDSYLISGAVKFDRVKLKAQYGLTKADLSDEELTLIGVGADYKLAKSSKVYAYFAQVEQDLGDQEDTTFGVGFEHKFSM
ncbi:outer membrane porin [Marinobacter lipolyticus SM19]|uniref:Outer membrane porin n=1 Tax=Marinobacter lipolyticus SM19 TaxID=1318628 RepID=R8B461_9GAMM|nr:porin [Marinobacter lipolyticus]EON93395.1 outer membrane porin [Marinobacter lipolyticus SM19]